MMTRTLFTIFILLTLVSCKPSTSFSGKEKEEVEASVRQTLESEQDKIDEVYSTMSLAYSTYDIHLIDKIYADKSYAVYAGDTTSLSNNREKLLAGFQRTFDYHKERGISLDMKFKFLEREKDHEMAFDIGYYRIDKTDKAGIKTTGKPGKFVTVLQRQTDGSWKFKVDIYGDASASAFQ